MPQVKCIEQLTLLALTAHLFDDIASLYVFTVVNTVKSGQVWAIRGQIAQGTYCIIQGMQDLSNFVRGHIVRGRIEIAY
jgi:hypothetical protein